MADGPGYRCRATLYASLAKGGSLQAGELVDYPGILFTNIKANRDTPWTRVIDYKGVAYDTIEAAVAAWTADGNDLV